MSIKTAYSIVFKNHHGRNLEAGAHEQDEIIYSRRRISALRDAGKLEEAKREGDRLLVMELRFKREQEERNQSYQEELNIIGR